jgi:hypothetical protein
MARVGAELNPLIAFKANKRPVMESADVPEPRHGLENGRKLRVSVRKLIHQDGRLAHRGREAIS